MSQQINQVYEFGDFRLESAERLLLHAGKPISLTPKAFETLLVLVQSSGHVIQKDELMRRVWADAFVEEVNLARNIWTLRKALGDDHREHRYIETVPKLGYRFIAPVRELPDETAGVLVRRRLRARIVTETEESADAGSETSPASSLTTPLEITRPSAVALVDPRTRRRQRLNRRVYAGLITFAFLVMAAVVIPAYLKSKKGRPAFSSRFPGGSLLRVTNNTASDQVPR